MKEAQIVSLILAAGSSSRMHKAKQCLSIHGEPLLKKIVQSAFESRAARTFVVLGHNPTENHRLIENLNIAITIHNLWNRGIGSSIKKGINDIVKVYPQASAILILLCDQPFVTTDYLNTLIDRFLKNEKGIVASAYGDTIGVPAIFDKQYFSALMGIADNLGAKKIIQDNSHDLLAIKFPGGEIDLDTPEDYEAFIQSL